MRGLIIAVILVATSLAPIAVQAGDQGGDPHVAILGMGMAGPHTLRITIATSGVGTFETEPPAVALTAWLDGVPVRAALPLIRMPARFAMDLDLPAGVVRVGEVAVGTFEPIRPFEENLRFPVEVTLSDGQRAATARQTGTILLPTVIVPGYLNEMSVPERDVLDAFARYGYEDDGLSPTLFWYSYASRRMRTLEGGGVALAAYVRQVVLPTTYATKINVIGFSLGGLMARWNVAYDTDGWAMLVNRLVLVGVPNEGSVMAYLGRHTPFFVPFSGFGHSAVAHILMPTFPFWRSGPDEPWRTPPEGRNVLLDELNARPIPSSIRVYIFYGSHDPRRPAGPQTAAGITGPELSYAAGDGVVLAESAQGLPINGGSGVPALTDRAILRVNLGAVYHTRLLYSGAHRIADALQDRFSATVNETAPVN